MTQVKNRCAKMMLNSKAPLDIKGGTYIVRTTDDSPLPDLTPPISSLTILDGGCYVSDSRYRRRFDRARAILHEAQALIDQAYQGLISYSPDAIDNLREAILALNGAIYEAKFGPSRDERKKFIDTELNEFVKRYGSVLALPCPTCRAKPNQLCSNSVSRSFKPVQFHPARKSTSPSRDGQAEGEQILGRMYMERRATGADIQVDKH